MLRVNLQKFIEDKEKRLLKITLDDNDWYLY